MNKEKNIFTYTELRIDNLTEPLGIDSESPSFSWVLESDERGQKQTSYRLLVASREDLLEKDEGDVWDSGRVESDKTYEAIFAGEKLKSSTEYFWKVKSWDKDGKDSGWSGTSAFETAIMEDSDWGAGWIGDKKGPGSFSMPDLKLTAEPAPVYRKEFSAEKNIRSARAYAAGLGLFELRINGKKAGDSYLNPANTDYNRKVYYLTFDITNMLKQGKNAVTMELGNGFYNISETNPWNWDKATWRNPSKLRLRILINYTDGTSDTVVSDGTWKLSYDGPVLYNDIYWGEVYDARKEQPGSDMPYFDDSSWLPASVLPAPEGILKAQTMEPIKATEITRPVSVTNVLNNINVFENAFVTAGIARIKASAPAGTQIEIAFGEKLNNDGTLNRFGLNDVNGHCQTVTYIFKGEDIEIYEPKFSYYGYKYVQISGFPGEMTADNVEFITLHNSLETISSFKCSNELFNQLHTNMKRTILNNFHGKPTDTPAYEKNGWMGDANVSYETMFYNFNMTQFLTKWIRDMQDSMNPQGVIPVIVPTEGWGMGHQIVWTSAYVYALWNLYKYTGNTRLLKEQFESITKFIDYTIRDAESRGWTADPNQLGDWSSPGADLYNPELGEGEGCAATEAAGITATLYTFDTLRTAGTIAGLLGKNDFMARCLNAASYVEEAFNKKFFDPDKNIYQTDVWNKLSRRTQYRQTDNILPLVFGVVPDRYKQGVIDNLVNDIKDKDYHLDTGLLGTKYILTLLTGLGYNEIANKIANQRTYPSWGFWIDKGATTMWETWETTARSYDHYFLGTVDEWFFKVLAGIDNVQNGYECFDIKPVLPVDMDFAEASVMTARGTVAVSCRKDASGCRTEVSVPVGSRARICILGDEVSAVTESSFVRFTESPEGCSVYEVGSGKYIFQSK